MNLREKLRSEEPLSHVEREKIIVVLENYEHLKAELPGIVEEARQETAIEVCERIQEAYGLDEDDDPLSFSERPDDDWESDRDDDSFEFPARPGGRR